MSEYKSRRDQLLYDLEEVTHCHNMMAEKIATINEKIDALDSEFRPHPGKIHKVVAGAVHSLLPKAIVRMSDYGGTTIHFWVEL